MVRKHFQQTKLQAGVAKPPLQMTANSAGRTQFSSGLLLATEIGSRGSLNTELDFNLQLRVIPHFPLSLVMAITASLGKCYQNYMTNLSECNNCNYKATSHYGN